MAIFNKSAIIDFVTMQGHVQVGAVALRGRTQAGRGGEGVGGVAPAAHDVMMHCDYEASSGRSPSARSARRLRAAAPATARRKALQRMAAATGET